MKQPSSSVAGMAGEAPSALAGTSPKWDMKIVYVSLSHLGEECYFFSSGHVSWNSISSEEALRSCSMLMIAAAGMEIRSPAT